MRSTTVVRLRRNRSTPSLDDLKPADADADAEPAAAPPARRAGIMEVATGQRTIRGLFLVVGSLFGLGLVSLTVGVDGAGTTTVGDYLAGGPGEVLAATDGAFRAEFPSPPQRRSQEVDANGAQVTVVDYTAGSEDHTFTVSYAGIPPGQEVGDPVLRLNASANGAAEAVKGELRTTAITSFLGLPAVEYVIVVEGRYIKATSFLSGRRLYGVQVVGRRDPPDGYDRFRAAFQLGS